MRSVCPQSSVTTVLQQIPWYEEYPTEPPSFVLNGFIYSLIGLYDLLTLAPALQARDAAALFQQGMKSLKKLLLAFDNGSGTNYDLRHLTIGCAPNIARYVGSFHFSTNWHFYK